MGEVELYHRTFLPLLPKSSASACPTDCHDSRARYDVNRFGSGLLSDHTPKSPFSVAVKPPEPAPPRFDPRQRRINGYLLIGNVPTSRVMVEKPDQRFADHATAWELRYSSICQHGGPFAPVVDENWTVVGHLGEVNGTDLIVPEGLTHDQRSLAATLDMGPVFVLTEQASRVLPAGWARWGILDFSYDVITSIDGEVVAAALSRSREGVESDEPGLLELIAIVTLTELAIRGGALLVKSLVRKTFKRVALRGATRELAEGFAKRESSFARGLKLSRGYDARMGIPEEHLGKMIEAAKEKQVIAVFRANKSAAIPLIRDGAVPKGKYFTFKSSPKTGVLMATEPQHVGTAYAHNFFVVEADGVARRTVRGATEELRLQNPSWTVEKGQVIAPNGKPVVGDYDLLGVLPLESPGRNLAAVPGDTLTGDWVGPDVERYAQAVNSRLDQPRVLHGAQDQFHHQQYGGLTNDVAYAVYPDGSVFVMEGRAAQENFYKAYGRQHAMGSYPRPGPNTPVQDELAAKRAKK